MKTHIYFVQSGKKGPIKIGIASNVCKRIDELQIGNPYKLNLIAAIPVTSRKMATDIEKWMHRRFKTQHIRGEWFQGNIKVQKLINIIPPEYLE